jgi:hypothetical protein
MFFAVIIHYDRNVATPAVPGFISGDTVDIIEDDSRGSRDSVASEECIDIYACSEAMPGRMYTSILKACQQCRVVTFGLQLMKGDVIRAFVTSRKPSDVFGTQPIVWCLGLGQNGALVCSTKVSHLYEGNIPCTKQ